MNPLNRRLSILESRFQAAQARLDAAELRTVTMENGAYQAGAAVGAADNLMEYRGTVYGCYGFAFSGLTLTFWPWGSSTGYSDGFYEKVVTTDGSGRFSFMGYTFPGSIPGYPMYPKDGYQLYAISDSSHVFDAIVLSQTNNDVVLTLAANTSAGYACWPTCGPLAYSGMKLTDNNGTINGLSGYGWNSQLTNWRPIPSGYTAFWPTGIVESNFLTTKNNGCWRYLFGATNNYIYDTNAKSVYCYYLVGDTLTLVGWKYSGPGGGIAYIGYDSGFFSTVQLNNMSVYVQRAAGGYAAGINPGIVWQDSASVSKTCGATPTWTFTFSSGGLAAALGISTVTLTAIP